MSSHAWCRKVLTTTCTRANGVTSKVGRQPPLQSTACTPHLVTKQSTCLTPTGVAQMRCSERSVAALAASYTKARPSTTLTRGRQRLPPVSPCCCARSARCDGMSRKEVLESCIEIQEMVGRKEGPDARPTMKTKRKQ